MISRKAKPLQWRAALWLLLLGPIFFISYGGANWYAAQQAQVGYLFFEWERQIPFVPWTIIPYWSIDLFYALSLFICSLTTELNTLVRRLLTAQVIAVCAFLLFPLQFSFERPQADGLFGGLFAALYTFDQPFNQAPSLHIALLVILWKHYQLHLPRRFQPLLHLLSLLIAVSVLTTYQHHFIDIPTGALLGWFTVWLWPHADAPGLSASKRVRDPKGRQIAAAYLLAAMVIGWTAIKAGDGFLWLLWPAVSLLMVALFYAIVGSQGFQKGADGRMSMAAKWLLFPYLIAAWINSRLWTRKTALAVQIDDNLWLGRFPSRQEIRQGGYASVIDMSAELPAPGRVDHWHALPSLDLLVPSAATLHAAAELIDNQRSQGRGSILVVCALGYSRSAMAVATWLLRTQRAETVDAAIEIIRSKRPEIVLGERHHQRLQELLDAR